MCHVEIVKVKTEHGVIVKFSLISPVPLLVLSVHSCAHLFCLVLGEDARRKRRLN